MVTFAQAQERADEWVNGDVPAYQTPGSLAWPGVSQKT